MTSRPKKKNLQTTRSNKKPNTVSSSFLRPKCISKKMVSPVKPIPITSTSPQVLSGISNTPKDIWSATHPAQRTNYVLSAIELGTDKIYGDLTEKISIQ